MTTMITCRSQSATAFIFLLITICQPVMAQQTGIQFARPADQRGINIFEPPKDDTVPFQGLRVQWGAAFTQQFQALSHENDSQEEIIEIGPGFNLATANLNLDAQVADGMRVHLITYLSSRHHPEAWVKGGYFQIDKLPFFDSAALDNLMRFVTLRLGHFEINYGDAHFRRTDNGNAMHNPFVGNYLMDSFTTEIGGELYIRSQGWLAMGAITGGEIQGSVVRPEERAPSVYAKVGVDRYMTPELRFRLMGSVYRTAKSLNNTLHSGDRAGSRYYMVLSPPGSSPAQTFYSGRVVPGLRNEVTAFQINPFIKYGGLELFGVIEFAEGSNVGEIDSRNWSHFAAEAVYRFGAGEQAFLGGRYSVAEGRLPGMTDDVTVDRIQIGGGWFVTRNVLAKVEYVSQNYRDFPTTAIEAGGSFNGLMIEGVVAF